MVNKKNSQLHGKHQAPDHSSDPPPAYSPPASSIASSEASLWTVEPDFAPDFTNASQRGSGWATVHEFSTHLGCGSRTSAFIQAFLRPKAQPRLVNVRCNSQILPEDGPSDRQVRPELRGVPLDIVIMVVGENIEPFIAVGKRLLQDSHRVRIATHVSCESLVKDYGLDFFAISQDIIHPMAQWLRGPNAMNKAVGSVKRSLYQSYHNSWRACIASYNGECRPFLADAIIANPLAHAHIHCAERLSIPLHIMSTIIWSPTKKLPHPWAHIEGSENMDQNTANLLSYALVEETLWNTIIEPINKFRQHVLGFNGISSATGGRLMTDNEIPHTYFCPEVLVLRPGDWDNMIGMSNTSSSRARAIQDTVVKHGLRAILSQDCRDICRILNNANVLLADSIPHGWLLPRVAVVVHSGSIDQSALALQYGKPSVVIPHTADQFSRGIGLSSIGAAGAPLTTNRFSPNALYQALEFCLRPDIQESTRVVQKQVHDEAGLERAVQAFYRWLPPQVQKCDITNQNLAMYRVWNRPSLRISPEAAAVLVEEQLIKQTDIVLITRQVYNIECESSRPVEDTARDYWNGVTVAAKNIATSSDLVSMLPGMQRKSDDSSVKKPKRKNLAKDIGIGTARLFGNIALLPFTSTALVVNTVAYGVKGAKGTKALDEESATTDIAASKQSNPSANAFSTGRSTEDKGKALPSSVNTSQIKARDEEHAEAICRRHLDRGFKSPVLKCLDFRRLVVDRYQ
ncbi:UDP-Glycosyltransferase/glycogen phosphorylase [Aspergillus caelatus]|uniref:UDP-Glycosyltransferase/glycogen phosphorylase n=1 Tax=Aspergillus caelatus TaxID=61420 RepID=A0A5N7AM48_9EURO|nr:UDP-Glycosyltransferase/glycogen phosphorylase [Aspergillus caelatus]KAE8370947.1 UDP-Glycosyltransferase/glycogen phosphorylase [Aspergillus caelatus]